MRPGVHQVVASFASGDAIGNEVLGINRVLRAAGYESRIFVETAASDVAHLATDFRDAIDGLDEDDLLILHFSIGSRSSRTAFALPNRMVLVYHNITPPEYFVGVHPWLARQCYHGRRELWACRNRVELALGDSEYNRIELEGLGFPATGVLPIVPDFSHLAAAPDRFVLDAFDDDLTNVLFVGRVVPNKRPDQIIRFFHAYQTLFNPDSRLILAGSYVQFERYLAQLHHLVATLGTRNVVFYGQAGNAEVTALYDVADLFLCASEHEGFCVPLVEAFYKRVPVMAYAAAAVPSTMDGAGILFDTVDPFEVACLMEAVLSDEALEDRLLAGQDAALERHLTHDFKTMLLGYIERVLAAPRRPPAPVAEDFWQQYRLAEELEEIRYTRPSAFHALPFDRKKPLAADVSHRS